MPWLGLLLLAVILFVLGFTVIAHWIFIVAVIVLLFALFTGFSGRGRGGPTI